MSFTIIPKYTNECFFGYVHTDIINITKEILCKTDPVDKAVIGGPNFMPTYGLLH